MRDAGEVGVAQQRQDWVIVGGEGQLDLSARREFLYVGDLLAAIRLAVERWDALPETLNVGFGEDFTVLQYYERVCEVVGVKPRFRFEPSRPVGMTRKLLDSSEAFTLGYRPQTSHHQGIASTYAHFLSLPR
jgi:GDP-L-fucose synthase